MISNHFSSAIFNSVLTKKALVHRHAKINGHGHGRTVRIPALSTTRVLFRPSAMMVDDTSKEARPLVTVHAPSIWGDVFSTFSFDDQLQQKYSKEIEALKKDTINMLKAATSRKLMILIDKLERLGLAYHFEAEIEEKLKQVYDSEEEDDYDMFTTALRFRLLRKHQYHVSCNVFEKFVDKDNKFILESLSSDVEGLLSLYEAAHVRIHDENILEEALAFTTSHLARMLLQLESPLTEEVQHALRFPLHKSPTIITLRSYIDIYENDHTKNELLLRLAKLNFNFMQNAFKNELFQLTEWWNMLNMTSKVPYFRDRVVECYVWSLSNHVEPQYSIIRMLMTKLYMMVTILDDTYDNYATLEEITLFTRALERWNIEEIDVLPHHYLKWVYKFIMSVSEEFAREAEKQGKSYATPYCIEVVKQLARGYGKEQKWIMEKQMPSFEEYMINSRITSVTYAWSIVVLSLTKSGTKETIDWVLSDPQILIASSDIVRLSDDLQDIHHQCVSEAGAILAYMKETGASVQETESEFKELTEDRWKHLTVEWVNCRMAPKEILTQFIDIARMCGIFCINEEDHYTYPEKTLAPLIIALFVDPILV